MKVLVLSPYPERIEHHIRACGDVVEANDQPIAVADADFIVSYGYRHILKGPIIERFSGRMVNIHISMLPWNRGADPNLWSWIFDTPKGVTIHYIDAGIDTGPIALQTGVAFTGHSRPTLRTTQDELMRSADALFAHAWPALRHGRYGYEPMPQRGTGSYHRSREREKFFQYLPDGYDTPIDALKQAKREFARDYFYP